MRSFLTESHARCWNEYLARLRQGDLVLPLVKGYSVMCKGKELTVIVSYHIYMVLKTQKIRTHWHVFLNYFITRPSFKNLHHTFFVPSGVIFFFLLLVLERIQKTSQAAGYCSHHFPCPPRYQSPLPPPTHPSPPVFAASSALESTPGYSNRMV